MLQRVPIKPLVLKLKAYENIDCNIFGEYFASKFNIIKRFVGKETYCNVTNTY